jgi:hypothetical protein
MTDYSVYMSLQSKLLSVELYIVHGNNFNRPSDKMWKSYLRKDYLYINSDVNMIHEVTLVTVLLLDMGIIWMCDIIEYCCQQINKTYLFMT